MCEKCNENLSKADLSPSFPKLTDEGQESVLKLMKELDKIIEEEEKGNNKPVMTKDYVFDKILKLEKATGLDLIITGSVVFAIQGLIEWSEVKDIDVVVNKKSFTQQQQKLLEALQIASPPLTTKEGYPPLLNTFRFIFQGVEINVFVKSTLIEFTIEPAFGIKISNLIYIIKEKRLMGRKKDYQQLNNYAKQFII